MPKIVIRGCMEDPNSVQLGLIREIHEALTTHSIPHWLVREYIVDQRRK